MNRLLIRKVAVLGAGVMGAQIAAHCVNAGIPVLLFDLPGSDDEPNAIVTKALQAMRKLDPAPFASKAGVRHLQACNYAADLERLAECELVIEAIAEKMEWKHDLYRKILPHLNPQAILVSNTSGLSITELAAGLPQAQQRRFCGLHFFNPPRYMPLVELIPTADTEPAMLDALESWLTTRLGKNVIRALDTPNFVANRVGVFALLAVLHHTERLGLAFDEVDLLTGTRIGRPKSATFRTADLVGLDTFAHVLDTMEQNLEADPWHPFFRRPQWLQTLLEGGALGHKSGAGVYRRQGRQLQVFDAGLQDYRDSGGEVHPDVDEILRLPDASERLARLAAHPHPQAQFLWSVFRDLFHYCAVHLVDIAANARDIDLAMRWGFGWALGPFESWQLAGWAEIRSMVAEDIAQGRAMAAVPLPAWVFERDGVHEAAGSWSAAQQGLQPRSPLAVYQRQLYPERVVGETADEQGETLWENDGLRLWRRPDCDAGIGIVSFTSKMHAIGNEVLDGMLEALARAEQELDGLVIWHPAPFAVGADLQQLGQACAAQNFDLLDQLIVKFQRTTLAIKHAQIPVVAAVQGMALGGGCEFVMHAAHRVLALESYIGLVEVGVGLIPAGGGCKEFALRAHRLAQRSNHAQVFAFIEPAFQAIAQATVAKSATEAVERGFARRSDDIVFNPHELLYMALQRARMLATSGWRPPLREPALVVAGRDGIANCEMMLVNMHEGGFISAHDYRVGKALATALCGGEVDTGSKVSEQWILDVERAQFFELLHSELSQQRIAHMLETGKPLRN